MSTELTISPGTEQLPAGTVKFSGSGADLADETRHAELDSTFRRGIGTVFLVATA